MRFRRSRPNNGLRPARRIRNVFETRAAVLRWGFVAAALFLVGRAFMLQVIEHDVWSDLAGKNQKKAYKLNPRRGPIVDRNDVPLARSVDVDSVFVEPPKLVNRTEAAITLADLLDLDEQKLRGKLEGTKKGFLWIKRKITVEESRMVAEAKLAGVGFLVESARKYPQGTLAGPLIGFAGLDNNGLAGIEASYEKTLAGEAGYLVGAKDARGVMYFPDGVKYVGSKPGGTVRLTLDAKIQHDVEEALKEGMAAIPAARYMALVMDPSTGEILAMAQYPEFDPNDAGAYPKDRIANHVLEDVFEPGSVMKPYIIAGALQDGLVRPDDTVFCENGALRIGARTIHDSHPHGTLTISWVVGKSSNIGAAKIGFRLGEERMHAWLSAFGFGRPTGIDLPGESGGRLAPASAWSKIEMSNIAFGQGISTNCVQMLTAYCTLINGGFLVRPYVVAEVLDEHGRQLRKNGPEIVREVLSRQASREIAEMLHLATTPEGTGKAAVVPGYEIAGKTGTAQKSDPRTHTYPDDMRIGSFIGSVPAQEPQAAIYVVVDEPRGLKGQQYGAVCAAPVFRKIAASIMPELDRGRLSVPVSKPQERKMAEADPAAVEVTAMLDGSRVPNFMGLSSREILHLAGQQNLELTLVGNGVAVRQEPEAGAAIDGDRKVRVTLGPS